MQQLLYGERRLTWPLGHSKRLALRGILPYVVLAAEAIRFERFAIQKLLRLAGKPPESTEGRTC